MHTLHYAFSLDAVAVLQRLALVELLLSFSLNFCILQTGRISWPEFQFTDWFYCLSTVSPGTSSNCFLMPQFPSFPLFRIFCLSLCRFFSCYPVHSLCCFDHQVFTWLPRLSCICPSSGLSHDQVHALLMGAGPRAVSPAGAGSRVTVVIPPVKRGGTDVQKMQVGKKTKHSCRLFGSLISGDWISHCCSQ